MNTNFLKILAIAVIASFLATSCGSSKKIATDNGDSSIQKTDDEIAKLEREAKLIEAQGKVDAARIKAEQEKRKAEQLAAQNATLDEGSSIRLVPCQKEGHDKAGEYYAGFGIGESLYDEDAARKEARNAARADLEGKFVGIIDNILTDYNSKTGTPSNQTNRENNLENGLRTVTHKVLNDYFNVVCDESVRTAQGTIKWYVAGQIPIDKFKHEVANELDVLKVKYNRDKLFESMDEQINKQIQAEQKEIDDAVKQQSNSESN